MWSDTKQGEKYQGQGLNGGQSGSQFVMLPIDMTVNGSRQAEDADVG